MEHTRNQKRMYRIKKLEERIVDLENISKKSISELSKANDKLNQIEEYINYLVIFEPVNGRIKKTIYGQEILEIIKGDEDK